MISPQTTGVGMGNVLESDSSADGDIGEIRTDGDGMETERPTELPTSTTLTLQPQTLSTEGKKERRRLNGSAPLSSVVELSPRKNRTSPRTLPPAKDLILLKPIRIGDSSSRYQPHLPPETLPSLTSNATSRRQREPKFVPYEPYAGAVRPMGPSLSSDERRDSSASSSIVAVSDDFSIPSVASPKKSGDSFRPAESSNTALLKERLRLAEKDIQELETENGRLKRLLVDTLSGSRVEPVDVQSVRSSKLHDTVESLSNEVQVWRSKFLSSCVLVEQLTKEKEDLVRVTGEAAELFKEIKNRVDLTPEMYTALRQWISAEEKERTLRKESSFASILDDDD